jgi:4-hydroxybenzoate polyprenyltransferase
MSEARDMASMAAQPGTAARRGARYPRNHPIHLLRALRPHQWVKNAFVFVGLLFSHRWDDLELATRVVVAAASFSLVASSMYVFNDLTDLDKDRIHPTKRLRPLPAGDVTVGVARVVGSLAFVFGILLGVWASWQVFAIVSVYVAVTVAYTVRLKRVVVLDVFIIASGFMLRILAGTVGVGVEPSEWLLQCGLMVTLFLGFAKRRAEISTLAEEGGAHRAVLQQYTTELLDKFLCITAAAVIMSYSLYTTSPQTVESHGTTDLIYTVPFIVFGMFRYVFLLVNGGGGDPARDLFGDRQLLAAVVAWFVVTLALIAG